MAEPLLVVDTDVASYLFKVDTRAAGFEAQLDGHLLILSFMSLAELERWALDHTWGSSRRRKLKDFLTRFLVAGYDERMCRIWAEVVVASKRAGRPISTADAWIAATALHFKATLLTNSPSDYAGVSGLGLRSALAG